MTVLTAFWQSPADYANRPVAILGAGVLGRRIACIWASAGYNVRVRDPSPQQRVDCVTYVEENVASYAEKTGISPGKAEAFEDMKFVVENAWLVIEAVPEKIQLKIDTFAELDALSPADCILASNSSSYKSSEMLEKVSTARKSQILNMHYYMPPACMIVELMTDGFTDPAIFPFLVERTREGATSPYVARKESTGFIFNRLWAAVKRETLTILSEGVSVPEEIDAMWEEMFVKGRSLPCKMMDNVGLDTVAFIEGHYIHERGLSFEHTVDFLKKNYLDHDKLGNKCVNGGLYPPVDATATPNGPRIVVLDIGLASDTPGHTQGEILEVTLDGKLKRVLVSEQNYPDGLDIDYESDRMFWTTMGIPGKDDGSVYSAKTDGTDIRQIVPSGVVNTPKQLVIVAEHKKIYFCDREGLRVFRCNYDGSSLELLIDNRGSGYSQGVPEHSKWCVGITVSPKLGKFFWTQKGVSKGGKGRIFTANIEMPSGQSPKTRDDIKCVLAGLPEPVDLELREDTLQLYWTDRGELPYGNTLNRAQLTQSGLLAETSSQKHEVLTKHLHEAIGLKLDTKNGHIYMTDLGGSIYQCDLEGKKKKVIYSDETRAFTGITLL
ncbi:Dehydrogenase, multihelical [Penicillium expansum]|uniref:Dehydrogenase, multihelical n=1 Tax=Penicillium expansum TaxID=27334 RepID=A0A0A2KDF1_PENEN|nr:Dehydrogenase, multihelical [Penicillium expansum]KGO37482.1 Dehydrogenase, multihelical [Penicillium expansum]KGO50968.1 Dehydrogenase, multihelical [Penicillium expansum]KGO65814.1 Dehydrogenase, multihelical [Penicillium expansum]